MYDPLASSIVLTNNLTQSLTMTIDTCPDSSSLSSDTAADDMEAQTPNSIYNRLCSFLGHPHVDTKTLLEQKYPGNGTQESPFLITFLPNDPQNPMTFPLWKKWFFTALQALATLATTFASSAYSGGIKQVISSFNVSQEVATMGISFYVLGFALGPLVWAPLSELYGRRKIFFLSFMAATAFSAGAAGAGSIAALLVLRFLVGSIGSAPMSNAPGVIADMFDKSQRGLAMCMFSGAPFLGPAAGKFMLPLLTLLMTDDVQVQLQAVSWLRRRVGDGFMGSWRYSLASYGSLRRF